MRRKDGMANCNVGIAGRHRRRPDHWLIARLRATVTAAHEKSDIEKAMDVIIRAGRTLGVLS